MNLLQLRFQSNVISTHICDIVVKDIGSIAKVSGVALQVHFGVMVRDIKGNMVDVMAVGVRDVNLLRVKVV